MKFKNIYTVAGILGLFVLLQSRAGGPATQGNLKVTGAPGDNGTCANTSCHTAGSFEPTLSMSLFDGANLAIKYEAGKTYTLKITNSPISGNPSRYGFQALALDADNAQAGDWGTAPSGMVVKPLSTKQYIEHSAPAANGVFEMPWVAPAAGTGPVTFYAASIAANNNSQSTGDGTATNTLVIQEIGTSNTDSRTQDFANLEVMPNPVADMLNLRITSALAGDFKIQVYSANGKMLKTANASLQAGQNIESMPVGELAPGLYLVQLSADGHSTAVQIIKQ